MTTPTEIPMNPEPWTRVVPLMVVGEKSRSYPMVVRPGVPADLIAMAGLSCGLARTDGPIFDQPAEGMPNGPAVGISGERYIYRAGSGRWSVMVGRQYVGMFDTVAGAVAGRDRFMADGTRPDPEPKGGRLGTGISGEPWVYAKLNGWYAQVRGVYLGYRSSVAEAVVLRDRYLDGGDAIRKTGHALNVITPPVDTAGRVDGTRLSLRERLAARRRAERLAALAEEAA